MEMIDIRPLLEKKWPGKVGGKTRIGKTEDGPGQEVPSAIKVAFPARGSAEERTAMRNMAKACGVRTKDFCEEVFAFCKDNTKDPELKKALAAKEAQIKKQKEAKAKKNEKVKGDEGGDAGK